MKANGRAFQLLKSLWTNSIGSTIRSVEALPELVKEGKGKHGGGSMMMPRGRLSAGAWHCGNVRDEVIHPKLLERLSKSRSRSGLMVLRVYDGSWRSTLRDL